LGWQNSGTRIAYVKADQLRVPRGAYLNNMQMVFQFCLRDLIEFTWQFAGEEEETEDIGWQKEVG
jgi:hypothetical protein